MAVCIGHDNRHALGLVGPVILKIDRVFILLTSVFQRCFVRRLQVIRIAIDDVTGSILFDDIGILFQSTHP